MDKPFCPKCEGEYKPGFKLCPFDGTELVIRSEDKLTGQVFDDRYKILHKLGEGGMGAVYKARQLSTGKSVAIKVVAGHLTENPATVRRFQREVRLQSKLEHPNIVTIIDFSKTPDGQYYFVMSFVEGKSLRATIMDEGKTTPRTFFNYAEQLCDGLEYAHLKGVVHRDLKGENIIVAPMGHQNIIKILDFGLAKATHPVEGSQSSAELTQQGRALGTPAYMAPEQAKGEMDKVGPTSDIYSLGVIFYQMLNGDLPFKSDTPWGLMHKHITEAPPSLKESNPDIPPELEAIVLRCLEKEPQNRYQSAFELKEDLVKLEAWSRSGSDPAVSPSYYEKTMVPGPRPKGPRPGIVMAVIVIIVLAGGTWFLSKNRPGTTGDKVVETIPAPGAAPEPTPAPEPATEPVEDVTKANDQDQARLDQIAELLAGASKDIGLDRLTEPAGSNALEKYMAVVELDPNNEEAAKGMERIVERYVEMADDAIDRSDFQRAEELLSRAELVSPDSAILGEARARLDAASGESSYEMEKRAELQRQKEEAEKQAELQRQKEEADKLAELERKRLEIKTAESPRAQTLKSEAIVAEYIEIADAAMASEDFDKASEILDKAATMAPDSENVNKAYVRLDRQKKEWATRKAEQARKEREARVARLIQENKRRREQDKKNRFIGAVESIDFTWGFVVVKLRKLSSVSVEDKIIIETRDGVEYNAKVKRILGYKASAIPIHGLYKIHKGSRVYRAK